MEIDTEKGAQRKKWFLVAGGGIVVIALLALVMVFQQSNLLKTSVLTSSPLSSPENSPQPFGTCYEEADCQPSQNNLDCTIAHCYDLNNFGQPPAEGHAGGCFYVSQCAEGESCTGKTNPDTGGAICMTDPSILYNETDGGFSPGVASCIIGYYPKRDLNIPVCDPGKDNENLSLQYGEGCSGGDTLIENIIPSCIAAESNYDIESEVVNCTDWCRRQPGANPGTTGKCEVKTGLCKDPRENPLPPKDSAACVCQTSPTPVPPPPGLTYPTSTPKPTPTPTPTPYTTTVIVITPTPTVRPSVSATPTLTSTPRPSTSP